MGTYITVFENRVDEPFRTFKDGCCGTVRTNEAGGDKFVLLVDKVDGIKKHKLGCKVIGDLYEENGYGSAGGRIYDITGLAPCIGASHFQQVKYIVVKHEI